MITYTEKDHLHFWSCDCGKVDVWGYFTRKEAERAAKRHACETPAPVTVDKHIGGRSWWQRHHGNHRTAAQHDNG